MNPEDYTNPKLLEPQLLTTAANHHMRARRSKGGMKLDHIQLAMPKGEEEKARGFFSGVLGMSEEVKPYPLSERGGCWFRAGSLILHIGVDKEFAPQKKAHPAFIVAGIEGLARKLKDYEHPVLWDDALPDRKRFYTSDPFGNRIEFLNEGDGFCQK